MYTVYMVKDEIIIPDVVEFLTYERPQWNSYKVTGKLIYDEGYEEEELFWESLANFLRDYRNCKEYDLELLPGVYTLWNGLDLCPEKVKFDSIDLVILETLEEFHTPLWERK